MSQRCKINCFGYVPGKAGKKKSCGVLLELVCEKGPCPFYKSKAFLRNEYMKLYGNPNGRPKGENKNVQL